MIVSHKHKFIFVKTHKTSTQTFLKFIKPHLGPDDVMAGDEGRFAGSNRDGDADNENTVVNVDKVFPATGKCALDYKKDYGNHLPWFVIKDVVGDDIWNEYTKFTIERDPYDRILSLFYFMNPTFIKDKLKLHPNKIAEVQIDQKTNREKYKNLPPEKQPLEKLLTWGRENTLLSVHSEAVREYFEDWVLIQLKSDVLDITQLETYGLPAKDLEAKNYKQSANELGLKKYNQMLQSKPVHVANNGFEFLPFPYAKDDSIMLWSGVFNEPPNRHILGQCRFLNYGYYYDGERVVVDHIVNMKNVGNNMGVFFKKFDIDIKCDTDIYNKATQNAHYRKNLKFKKPNNWWYNGRRGDFIKKLIKKKFYNKNKGQHCIDLSEHKI